MYCTRRRVSVCSLIFAASKYVYNYHVLYRRKGFSPIIYAASKYVYNYHVLYYVLYRRNNFLNNSNLYMLYNYHVKCIGRSVLSVLLIMSHFYIMNNSCLLQGRKSLLNDSRLYILYDYLVMYRRKGFQLAVCTVILPHLNIVYNYAVLSNSCDTVHEEGCTLIYAASTIMMYCTGGRTLNCT